MGVSRLIRLGKCSRLGMRVELVLMAESFIGF